MIGIHLPNDDISTSELDHIINLGCRDYVLYVSAFDANALTKYNTILDRFAQGQGSAITRVHVRVESRGRLDAISDSKRLKLVHDSLQGRYYSICIRNEPNIESSNTPTEYKAYVKALIENTSLEIIGRLALAPMSPKPGYLEWITAGIAEAGPISKHYIHAYGNDLETEPLFRAIRSKWAGEIICTEHNFGAGRKYDLQTWATDLPGVLGVASKYGIQSVNIFIWRWATPDMTMPTQVNIVGTPMEDAIRAAAKLPVVYSNYFSPNHGGVRYFTRGIVLHATRGGQDDYEAEFNSTLSWFSNPDSQASSHVVISPTRINYPVSDPLIAWHSGHKTDESLSLNPTHLGMEFCQGRLGMPIPNSEYKLAVGEAARLCVKYKIPTIHSQIGICEHYETAAGQSYGKSDIKLPFVIDKFVEDVRNAVVVIYGGIDWNKIHAYADWALARIANRQDPRIKADFITHLRQLGADFTSPNIYGWPG